MSYLVDADKWLTEVLRRVSESQDYDTPNGARHEIKAKLLQSFRNGQRACTKCNPRKPAASEKRSSE